MACCTAAENQLGFGAMKRRGVKKEFVLNMCVWDTCWKCTEDCWEFSSSVDKNREKSNYFLLHILYCSVSLFMT